MTRNVDKPQLITIPISHYCERARWALEHFGVDFVEDRHLQFFHRRATERVGGGSTPVLVHDGGVLTDSGEIVRWAAARGGDEAFCEADPELEQTLAGDFGAETRRLAYAWFLPERRLMLRYNNQGAPAWQGLTLRALYGPAMKRAKQFMKVGPDDVARGRALVLRTLDDLDARLDDGRPYLAGRRFSSVDLTFAALIAPTVMAPGYGVRLPSLDELPAEVAREAREIRERPAGRLALRLYADHRRPAG